MHVSALNDMARVTQSNKVLSTRMITLHQTLLTQYYAAALGRGQGKIAPDLVEATKVTAEKLNDMTDRLIGRSFVSRTQTTSGRPLPCAKEMGNVPFSRSCLG